MSQELIKLDENIDIITRKDEPILSSDIYIIKGKNHNFLFDCGSTEKALEIINAIPNRILILSHFHQDHMENAKKTSFDEIYLGPNTFKYLKKGIIVDKEFGLEEDNLKLSIIPFPSSHAKGSLCLKANEKYLFVGDGLCPKFTNEGELYNQGYLKSQIDLIESLDVKYIIESHSNGERQEKEKLLEELRHIYFLRDKKEPYIRYERYTR